MVFAYGMHSEQIGVWDDTMKQMQIGNRTFDWDQGKVYVMGILNVTPDSFSDGGRYDSVDASLYHVEEMIAQGVDLIDLGGESTRPGYQKISIEEEISRVVTHLEAIKERFDIPVSVDTYKAPVMDAALRAGADMANDIWGLRYEEFYAASGSDRVWEIGSMADVLSRYDVPICVMHNRPEPSYQEFLTDVRTDLNRSLEICENHGISMERVILDPGVGFGKTYENNLDVLAHLDMYRQWGLPLLLATSRKSVIGLTLDLPVDQREEGTMVTSVLAGMAGWQMVRVHDVEKNVRALKMLQKILQFR